ncbi:MAG: hypothetical protein AB1714_31970 [Acidobacteriota bacterium]
MAPSTKTRLMEVLVPALASILVALITTLSTLATRSGKLDQATQEAKNATEQAKDASNKAEGLRGALAAAGTPIGSILASPLTPDEFSQAAGDPPVFDPTRSKWALADGRQVVGSNYHTLWNGRPLPDLRGLFLRGMNAGRDDQFRDPDAVRVPGAPQGWSTAFPRAGLRTSNAGQHVHDYPGYGTGFVGRAAGQHASGGYPNPAFGAEPMTAGGMHEHDVEGGDAETRPNNASVFFYVRINP